MLYRWYEIPEGRTRESFAFFVEEIWSGRAIDEYFTDERADVEQVIDERESTLYDVRVTSANGAIEYYRPSH